jgi:hypothetical protein
VFASQEPPSGTPVAPSAGAIDRNNGTIRLPGLLVLTDGATPGRRQSNQSLGAAPSHNHPGGWYASYPGQDREVLWGGPGGPGRTCQPEPGALLILALFVSERFRRRSSALLRVEKFFLPPNWENVNISYIIGRPAMMGKANRLPP